MDLGGHDFHGSWGDSQGPPRRKERSTTEKVSCPKVELRIHVIHFEVHLMSENTYGDVFGAPVVRIGHPNSDGFGDWIPTVSEDRRLLLEDRSLSEKFGHLASNVPWVYDKYIYPRAPTISSGGGIRPPWHPPLAHLRNGGGPGARGIDM